MKKKLARRRLPVWMGEEEIMFYESIEHLLPLAEYNVLQQSKLIDHLWLISCHVTGVETNDDIKKDSFINMILMLN